MRHKLLRRILSGLLAGMLCLSMVPVSALADDSTFSSVPAAETSQTATPETAASQNEDTLSSQAQASLDIEKFYAWWRSASYRRT